MNRIREIYDRHMGYRTMISKDVVAKDEVLVICKEVAKEIFDDLRQFDSDYREGYINREEYDKLKKKWLGD